MKRPNFLLIGAAKCGTTALAYFLKRHPEIYFSNPKEPHFFSAQFDKGPFYGKGDWLVASRMVKSFDDYLALFEGVTNEKAIGEGSTTTIYFFNKTIPLIKKYIGYPKILIILRNPVDRAYSAYTHLVRDNRETLPFEKALQLEEYRKNNGYRYIWHFTSVGFYADQVKAFMDEFPEVKILIYDDFKRDPLNLLKECYSFLGVDPSFTPPLEKKLNLSGFPKLRIINRIVNSTSPVKKKLLGFFLPYSWRVNVAARINLINLYKKPMNPETRKKLIALFEPDCKRLEKIINRDLSNWYKIE